jgi:hypothetical protein
MESLMPTFRVRQQISYYVETAIEAESADHLQGYFGTYDIDEVMEDVEPVEGPIATGEPEVDPTDKKPQWKLRGDKLVKVKV